MDKNKIKVFTEISWSQVKKCARLIYDESFEQYQALAEIPDR